MKDKNKIEWGFFSILFVVLILLLVFYFSSKQKPNLTKSGPTSIESDKREKIPPTNTPTPKPIPHGKVEFTVSTGKNSTGPRMRKGSIDPYDPDLGATQTFTIDVDEPVNKVIAILTTDNKVSSEYQLKKTTGTTWQGSWKVNDSYLYKYKLTIKAVGPNGTSKVGITLR